jgi:hypothetical protein
MGFAYPDSKPASTAGRHEKTGIESPFAFSLIQGSISPLARLAATGGGAAAAPAANRHFRAQAEPGGHSVGHVIHGDILGRQVQLLIDEHGESVYLENIVVLFRFIQNHGQGWPGSPARLEENANRGDLFTLEVIFQNFFGLLGNVDHKESPSESNGCSNSLSTANRRVKLLETSERGRYGLSAQTGRRRRLPAL